MFKTMGFNFPPCSKNYASQSYKPANKIIALHTSIHNFRDLLWKDVLSYQPWKEEQRWW